MICSTTHLPIATYKYVAHEHVLYQTSPFFLNQNKYLPSKVGWITKEPQLFLIYTVEWYLCIYSIIWTLCSRDNNTDMSAVKQRVNFTKKIECVWISDTKKNGV